MNESCCPAEGLLSDVNEESEWLQLVAVLTVTSTDLLMSELGPVARLKVMMS